MTFDTAEYARQDFLERDETREGGARMFYAGEVPWHGLGKGVELAQVSGEAIKLAGLDDWNVHLEGFTVESGQVSEDWRAIVRGMDGKVLGVATPSYKPIQNEEAFTFLDSLIADRVLKYHSAGSLMGGRKVWVLAELDSDIRVGGDEYKEFLLLVMGHDNFTSLKIYTTKVRVICNNTLRLAQRSSSAAVRIVHAGNIDRKFDVARKLLNVTTEQQRRMTEWLERLSTKKVTADDVEIVQNKLFGSLDDETPTRRRDAIETFKSIYTAEQEREGRTGYALLQAVTGYADHGIKLRVKESGEQNMLSFLTGSGQIFKQTGIAALVSVTRIAAPAGLISAEA